MNRLAEVFNRLIDAGLKLKASKCTFFAEEIAYLGHVRSEEGRGCRALESATHARPGPAILRIRQLLQQVHT